MGPDLLSEHGGDDMTTELATIGTTELSTDLRTGEFLPNVWKPAPDMTLDEILSVGETLATIEEEKAWWIGSFSNWVEDEFGEDVAAQALSFPNTKNESVRNHKWLCRAFPVHCRPHAMGWIDESGRTIVTPTHYQKVASMAGTNLDMAMDYLDVVYRHRLTTRDFKDLLDGKLIIPGELGVPEDYDEEPDEDDNAPSNGDGSNEENDPIDLDTLKQRLEELLGVPVEEVDWDGIVFGNGLTFTADENGLHVELP
jgi:hypothetical protein